MHTTMYLLTAVKVGNIAEKRAFAWYTVPQEDDAGLYAAPARGLFPLPADLCQPQPAAE